MNAITYDLTHDQRRLRRFFESTLLIGDAITVKRLSLQASYLEGASYTPLIIIHHINGVMDGLYQTLHRSDGRDLTARAAIWLNAKGVTAVDCQHHAGAVAAYKFSTRQKIGAYQKLKLG